MMGAPDLFKNALGDLPEGDISTNALAAKALVRAGLAVVLIQPGGKKPACTLAAAASKKADLEAQEAARAAGNANWERVRHDCGRAHVLTTERELTHKRVKELLANGANLGVMAGDLGATRILVVDLDTREQARAFLKAWSAAVGREVTEPMTVASPGVMRVVDGGEEVWDHKDGGHYWMTLPEGVDLPSYPGKYVGEGDWCVYYSDAYALVPPSVRPEGPYRLTGAVQEAPAWLLEALQADITARQERRLERAQRMATEGPKDIDEWAAETPWDALLEAAGWTLTGGPDSCGCPTWTRPGSPAHLKSATAHETGCPVYDTSLGHGPLHVWSDNVEINGAKTASKMTFLAWSQYGNDMGAAMRSQGIEPFMMGLPEPTVMDDMEEFAAPAPAATTRTAVDHLRLVADGGASLKLLADPPPVMEEGEGQPTLEETPQVLSMDDLEAKYEQSIRFEQMKMFVREAAQRRHAEMTASRDWRTPEDLGSLSDMLSMDWPEDPFLIRDILPEDGNAVLTAQFKTGKTTFLGNVIRSLVDGDPFLDAYEVTQTGAVALWNYELTARMQIEWLSTLGIRNHSLVHPLHLRGERMPLLSPAARKWTVAWLKARNIRTWILDPWGPALAQTGGDENSNTDARALITVLDQIKAEAGVRELIVATHTGRGDQESGQEHARGATVLDDWPDARWILTRVKEGDQRFIRFAGRLPESQEMGLTFDPGTRRLAVIGNGDPFAGLSRKEVATAVKVSKDKSKVLAHIMENPGCSQNQIRVNTKIHDREVAAAVAELVEDRQVRTEIGPRSATLHFPTALAFPDPPGASTATSPRDGEDVKSAS